MPSEPSRRRYQDASDGDDTAAAPADGDDTAPAAPDGDDAAAAPAEPGDVHHVRVLRVGRVSVEQHADADRVLVVARGLHGR